MDLYTVNHIKILEYIKQLYNNEEYNCFINIGSIIPQQLCFHIHVLNKTFYKDNFTPLEQGSRINTMMDISKIINLLKLNLNYYNLFDCKILLHDKT